MPLCLKWLWWWKCWSPWRSSSATAGCWVQTVAAPKKKSSWSHFNIIKS